MPTEEIVRRCFISNSDGFGLAYHKKGEKVVILKGAMTIKDTLAMIEEIPTPKKCNVILHFRIATDGRVCPENCHPYPVSKKRRFLKAIHLETTIALAHNGVISIAEESATGKNTTALKTRKEQDLSDTARFIRYYLSGLGLSILNKQVGRLIDKAVGGRFVLLSTTKLSLIGTWVKDKESGLYYSHSGYEPVTPIVREPIKTRWLGRTPRTAYNIESKDGYCDFCNNWGKIIKFRYTLAKEPMFICVDCAEAFGFKKELFGYNYAQQFGNMGY